MAGHLFVDSLGEMHAIGEQHECVYLGGYKSQQDAVGPSRVRIAAQIETRAAFEG